MPFFILYPFNISLFQNSDILVDLLSSLLGLAHNIILQDVPLHILSLSQLVTLPWGHINQLPPHKFHQISVHKLKHPLYLLKNFRELSLHIIIITRNSPILHTEIEILLFSPKNCSYGFAYLADIHIWCLCFNDICKKN